MSKENGSIGDVIEKYQYKIKDIMNEIESILMDGGLEFTSNSKKTELVVSSESREHIQNLIQTSLSLPSIVTDILISIKESKGRVYIRQRIK